MSFTPLALEQWHSEYETTVAYNLADSGVRPVRLNELVADPQSLHAMMSMDLHYPPTAGTRLLRELIADWYGTRPDEVLVTVGAAEANSIVVAGLVEAGDRVVVMEPGYRQVHGCALNAGAHVRVVPLDPVDGWQPDLNALHAAAGAGTRLISVTNPNNPLGSILTDDAMNAIVAATDRSGAWLLADEVFRGSERLTDRTTPSFFGRHERVICVGSLSKAFGLPGLRIGWVVAPLGIMQRVLRRHEYATIATSALSIHLAELAMRPDIREQLLARNRELVRAGYLRFRQWIDASAGLVSIIEPQATSLGFVRYGLDTPSVELAQAIRVRAGVLVGPGSFFGAEGHLRLTHGLDPADLDEALSRVLDVIDQLPRRAA